MSTQGISKRLKEVRKRNLLTQQELADKLGVSLVTVSRWENGERTPNITIMDKLSKMLNVPISYFTDKADDTGSDELVNLFSESDQSERKQNMAVLTFRNGEKIEAPATPDGYAFLERLFAMSLGGQPAMA